MEKKKLSFAGVCGLVFIYLLPLFTFLDERFRIWAIVLSIFIVLCFIFVRIVPRNTAIIVDRCAHYNKTVRRGLYIKVPFIDEITTKISTNTLIKTYSEVYETDDSKYFRVTYSVSYKAPDIEAVLLHLAADRRSIDDIIKCSLASTFKAYTSNFFASDIGTEGYNRTALNCSPFSIDIERLKLLSIQEGIKEEVFKPHVHKDDGPISYR